MEIQILLVIMKSINLIYWCATMIVVINSARVNTLLLK